MKSLFIKKFKLLIGLFIISFISLAQSPESMNYQAVIRNSSGTIIANQSIGIRIKILQSSANGSAVYNETFNPTTNAYGMVSLQIGTGSVVSGTFSSIDWGNNSYYVETAADVSGGSNYSVISATQFMSVPYALYAKSAGSSPADNDWTESGNNIFRSSGNVGIGTTNPSSKLDVNGTGSFTGDLISGGDITTGNNGKLILWRGGIQDPYIRHVSNKSIGFFTVDSEKMRIAEGGNVGISTTNPSSKLDVNGDINLTGDLKINGVAQTFGGSSGLEQITENGNTGFRLMGSDPNNFGDIGANSTDLSTQTQASTTRGATGLYSLASGENTTASSYRSTAMGNNTIASNENSTAMGINTNASGNSSTAMGNSTTASGTNSIAMGSNNTASGTSSTAMGRGTVASGSYSTSLGELSTASGSRSLAAGQHASATAANSIAIGHAATASGYGSIALGGEGNESAGLYSTAMGRYTKAHSVGELTIGSFNTNYNPVGGASTWDALDRLFVIGNGTSQNSRSNAFLVLKNGNTTINGQLNINGNILASGALTLLGASGITMTSASNGNIAIDPHGTGNLTLGSADNATTSLTGNTLNLTSSNVSTITGANGVNIDANSSEVDITSGTLDINSGMIDIDASSDFNITSSFDVRIRAVLGKIRLESDVEAQDITANDIIANTFITSSDKRFKKDIKPIASSLDNVLKLRGVSYNFKVEEYSDKKFPADTQIGFIAQELLEIYPQLISKDKEGYYSVDYSKISPILVEAIKEQQKKIDKLETELGLIKNYLNIKEE